jgi:hypothetical protein
MERYLADTLVAGPFDGAFFDVLVNLQLDKFIDHFSWEAAIFELDLYIAIVNPYRSRI